MVALYHARYVWVFPHSVDCAALYVETAISWPSERRYKYKTFAGTNHENRDTSTA